MGNTIAQRFYRAPNVDERVCLQYCSVEDVLEALVATSVLKKCARALLYIVADYAREKASLPPDVFFDAFSSEPGHIVPLAICGPPHCGKTALRQRLAPTTEQHTHVNASFAVVRRLHNSHIKLQIWEVPEEKELLVASVYHLRRNVVGVILVFDVGNKSTFHSVQRSWFPHGTTRSLFARDDAIYMLCGHHQCTREVNYEEAAELAKAHNMDYCECDATDLDSVQVAFYTVVSRVLRQM